MGGGADLAGGWGLQPNLLSFGSKGVGCVTAEFQLYRKAGGGSWGGGGRGGRRGGVGGLGVVGGGVGRGGGRNHSRRNWERLGTTRAASKIQTPTHFHVWKWGGSEFYSQSFPSAFRVVPAPHPPPLGPPPSGKQPSFFGARLFGKRAHFPNNLSSGLWA